MPLRVTMFSLDYIQGVFDSDNSIIINFKFYD